MQFQIHFIFGLIEVYIIQVLKMNEKKLLKMHSVRESCTNSDQRGILAQDPMAASSQFNRKSHICLSFFSGSDNFMAQDFSEQLVL